MRTVISRSVACALLACVTVLTATACAKEDLTKQWPAMAAPVGWEPRVGTCHSTFNETSHLGGYKPVDCTTSHGFETTHIGKFDGSVAAGIVPPTRTLLAAAWAECDAKTSEYLGGPWRDATIWIGVSVPSRGNWEGGARWFRCEAGVTTHRIGQLTDYSASVKGALTGESELRRGCYQIPKDKAADSVPTACNVAHNAEYVGSFVSNDTYEQLESNLASAHQKCRSLIARYVGVPDDGQMKYRTGSSYSYPSEQDWEDGDRGVRCHLWLDTKKLTSSLKGGGTKALPIN